MHVRTENMNKKETTSSYWAGLIFDSDEKNDERLETKFWGHLGLQQ